MCLVVYLVMNLAYSFYLKDVVLIDVFCDRHRFYAARHRGALVLNVARSSWLILTTMFLSLFLGIAKRRGELVALGASNTPDGNFHTRKVLEHYSVEFAEQMTTICAAGFVFSYALSPSLIEPRKCSERKILFLRHHFVLYGVFRYLYLLHKKQLGENPTEAVLSDIPMLLNFAAYAAAMLAIIYLR